jgi:hypothetical protein
MSYSTALALFALIFLFPSIGIGQECSGLKSASVQQVEGYIRKAPNKAGGTECVEFAFHRIASFPPNVAVPTLIRYLDHKRPLNEGERNGIFMHGPIPEELYPAIHELVLLGDTSEAKFVEAKLVEFIGNDENAKGIALEHALRTLLLIHHFDILPIIHELHNGSTSSTNATSRDRFQTAALIAAGWCPNDSKIKCEDALTRK